MSTSRLHAERSCWHSKAVLRRVYGDLYRRMRERCAAGTTLEIGAGTGNLEELLPGAVASDLQLAPWLDVACDAHSLPFAPGSFDNLLLFDVVHHLARPRLFFAEAERVLRPGGRVVMVEPAVTPLSWIFYRLLHPEPVDLADDPLVAGEPPAGRDPWESNQAIPTLLFGRPFGRHRARFRELFPRLELREASNLSFFAYPLSGGFRPWSLLPAVAAGPLLRLEDALAPALAPLAAFRLLVVLQRSG